MPRGVEVTRRALTEPPLDDPTDEWLRLVPFAALPQHTLGLAYLKEDDPGAALPWLEIAAELRPDDERIAEDLRLARRGG